MIYQYFKCDSQDCKVEHKHVPDNIVILRGIKGAKYNSGLLLPEGLKDKHFCNTECFLNWIIVNFPAVR
jgi:hypothetical protein